MLRLVPRGCVKTYIQRTHVLSFHVLAPLLKALKITELITAPLLGIRTTITKLLYRGQVWVSPFPDASHQVLSLTPQGLFQGELCILYPFTLGAQLWGLAYRRNTSKVAERIEILSDCGNLGLDISITV